MRKALTPALSRSTGRGRNGRERKPTERAPWALGCVVVRVAGLGGLFAPGLGRGFDFEEVLLPVDDVFADRVLAALAFLGEAVHQVEHDLFADGAEGAGAGVALE